MSNEIDQVHEAIKADLTAEEKGNQRSMIIGGFAALIIGGYLFFLHAQIARFLEPEELALAASGAAVDAAPDVEAQLRVLLIDGAPDIARTLSNSVVDAIPAYRAVLEDELKPVVDEVCTLLATTAVNRMLATEGGADAAQTAGTEEAAEAVMARLDTVLEEAMLEPSQLDGPSPADLIDASVEKLVVVDRGLRTLARGGGDGAERELVLTVLGAIDGSLEEADVVAADALRTKERAKNRGDANTPEPRAPAKK